jgi:hypothetical protein
MSNQTIRSLMEQSIFMLDPNNREKRLRIYKAAHKALAGSTQNKPREVRQRLQTELLNVINDLESRYSESVAVMPVPVESDPLAEEPVQSANEPEMYATDADILRGVASASLARSPVETELSGAKAQIRSIPKSSHAKRGTVLVIAAVLLMVSAGMIWIWHSRENFEVNSNAGNEAGAGIAAIQIEESGQVSSPSVD